MPLVKKIAEDWFPKENEQLQIGGIIEVTDPAELIRQGKVVVVDAQGQELPPVDPVARVAFLEKKLKEEQEKNQAEKTIEEKRSEALAKARVAKAAKVNA